MALSLDGVCSNVVKPAQDWGVPLLGYSWILSPHPNWLKNNSEIAKGKSRAPNGVELIAVSSAVAAALTFTLDMPTTFAKNVLIGPFALPSRCVTTLTDRG
jgi:hypothetical protein